jgi:hypothetical protein
MPRPIDVHQIASAKRTQEDGGLYREARADSRCHDGGPSDLRYISDFKNSTASRNIASEAIMRRESSRRAVRLTNSYHKGSMLPVLAPKVNHEIMGRGF